jgi:hypothetical protein
MDTFEDLLRRRPKPGYSSLEEFVVRKPRLEGAYSPLSELAGGRIVGDDDWWLPNAREIQPRLREFRSQYGDLPVMIPQGDKTREQGQQYAYDMTVKPVVDLGRFATGQMAPEELPGFGLTAAGLFLPMAKGVLRPAATALEVAAPQILRPAARVPQFDLRRYVPAGGTSERVRDLIANKDVRDEMLKSIARGIEMGGANFQRTDGIRQAFIQQLGEEAGNLEFGQYMDFIAANSPRSSVAVSVRNATPHFNAFRNGKGIPEIGTKSPYPYGHKYQEAHQRLMHRLDNGGFDPLGQPKVSSEAQNLRGNELPVAVDVHAFRHPAMLAQDERFLLPKIRDRLQRGELSMEEALKKPGNWAVGPNENEYASMEQYFKSLANEVGLTPAATRNAARFGGKDLTGLRNQRIIDDVFEDRVRRQAEHRGMDPEDVLRQFIDAKLPLIGFAGAGAMSFGSTLERQDDQSGF